jgi:phage-related tail fiber protein
MFVRVRAISEKSFWKMRRGKKAEGGGRKTARKQGICPCWYAELGRVGSHARV